MRHSGLQSTLTEICARFRACRAVMMTGLASPGCVLRMITTANIC